jgi:lipopolysaccharide transport system ATP-binding protein
MADIAARIEGIGKRYRLGETVPYKSLRESIAKATTTPVREAARRLRHGASAGPKARGDEFVWALRDVSFEVAQGEVVGIIGRNGAGKSTLLKILSRITEPTEGRAELFGKVAALLEVGTGFHPELTGRENVYLNGAILGMRKVEIDRKFDEIVAFAEIDKFLDTPVKRYSSGMFVRLAFAVAAFLEPEILVVDEVLSVGDAAFQDKCLGKMNEVASGGRTVLFVSHNMSAVASLCTKSYWLDSGRVVASGETSSVIKRYIQSARMGSGLVLSDRKDRTGTGALRFKHVQLAGVRGEAVEYGRSGEDLTFAIDYEAPTGGRLDSVEVNLIVVDEYGQRLFTAGSDVVDADLRSLSPQGRIECRIRELPLLPGDYWFHLTGLVDRDVADKIYFVGSFQVVEGDFYGTRKLPHPAGGSVLIRHDWRWEGY